MAIKERTLQETRLELEKNKIIQEFLAFIRLPVQEQQRIFDLWEQYYLDAQKTTTHELYQEIRSAYASGNGVRFKDLRVQMQQMRKDGLSPELPRPHRFEPLALYHDQLVIRYRNVLEDIKREMKGGTGF